jgi:SAM-dependent methyltransferase
VTAFPAPHGTVSQCRNGYCGHLFLAEPPEADDGGEKELDEVLAQHPNRNRRLVAYLYGEGLVGPGRHVLEYGPGGGHMAVAVRETFRTTTVSCVEVDPAVRMQLRFMGLDVFEDLDDLPHDHDAMLMVDVLETLADPVDVMSRLAKKLKPGGKMFVTTPLGETRRGDHTTSAYESRSHRHFFTERSLDQAVQMAGLSSFDFRVVNSLYDREPGLRGEAAYALKGVSRHAWRHMFGPRHLTGFATRA